MEKHTPKNFANNHIEQVITINFAVRTDLVDLFSQLKNSEQFLIRLSAVAGAQMIQGQTLEQKTYNHTALNNLISIYPISMAYVFGVCNIVKKKEKNLSITNLYDFFFTKIRIEWKLNRKSIIIILCLRGERMVENICAKATAYGASAIAIIRCSGPDAITLVNQVFKGRDLNQVASHTMNYGRIMEGKEVIDEVLCNVFWAPTSYDGENMVEINCHGGILVTNKVLELLLKIGFRMAEPGEFSKRAFLNHKLDLTQAEAIMDIIHAENSIALKAGQNALRQSTTKLIREFRERLLDILAKIEVNIDYPEYEDSVEVTREYLLPVLETIQEEMNIILKNSKISNLAIHGIKTAIVGKPNVGKSSLLNMLLEEDKAIVTDIPGTTRDIIEGSLTLGDVTLHLMDTAGIHQSKDTVEQIGIQRSSKAIEDADLVLVVLDASKPLGPEDLEILEFTKDKTRILIGNKMDQGTKVKLENMVFLSAKKGLGLNDLLVAIEKTTKLNEFNIDEGKFLANQRQIQYMRQAKEALNQAYQSCLAGVDIDLVEIDIKRAFDDLGAITGDATPEELITALFTKFCLGK